MQLLWTNLKLMNVFVTTNDEGVLIESITRGTRKHIYGAVGTNNETPVVEVQYELNAFFRTEWYPDITDTLDEIDVTVMPNNDMDANPVEVVYDFTTLTKGTGNGRSSNAGHDAGAADQRKTGAVAQTAHSPGIARGTSQRGFAPRPQAPQRR